MAYIILPHRWMRQPTAPLRLRAAWRPYIAFAHVPAGVQPDLVSSTLPTLAGTVNYRGTPHGVAMVPADDNSGFTWARTPLYDTATNGCAVLTIAAPAAQAEVDRHFALGDGAAGAYNQLTFGFNMDYGGSAASGSWSVLEYNSGYQTRSQTLSSSIVDGGWHVWIASRPAGSINYYSLVRDGFNQSLIPGSSSSGITLTAGINLQAPQSTATGQGSEHPSLLTVLFNRALRSSEFGAFTNIPDVFGELFEPLQRRIYVPSAGGGAASEGAADITLGALTVTATGALPITGSAAITLDALTTSAAGALPIAGSASITLGDLTLTAEGALTASGTGAAAITLDALTVTATGTLPIAGSASITLGALTTAAEGVLSAPGTGQASITLAPLTVTATGTLPITGAGSIILGDLALSAAGSLAISGAASITLAPLALVAAGQQGVVIEPPTTIGPRRVLGPTLTIAAARIGAARPRVVARKLKDLH